jgi:hypothetical protein
MQLMPRESTNSRIARCRSFQWTCSNREQISHHYCLVAEYHGEFHLTKIVMSNSGWRVHFHSHYYPQSMKNWALLSYIARRGGETQPRTLKSLSSRQDWNHGDSPYREDGFLVRRSRRHGATYRSQYL